MEESSQNIKFKRVPTGAVLSVILFLVAINGVADILEVNNNIKYLLYADDIVIFKSGENVEEITNELQNKINEINIWITNNGFKFSPIKTKAMHI